MIELLIWTKAKKKKIKKGKFGFYLNPLCCFSVKQPVNFSVLYETFSGDPALQRLRVPGRLSPELSVTDSAASQEGCEKDAGVRQQSSALQCQAGEAAVIHC